jgi:hypothetical protein
LTVKPVAVLLMLTFAAPITEPEESTVVPAIAPWVDDCATALKPPQLHAKVSNSTKHNAKRDFLKDIWTLLKEFILISLKWVCGGGATPSLASHKGCFPRNGVFFPASFL